MKKPPFDFLSVGITCACGRPEFVSFDVVARPYSRTFQCPKCGQVLEIRRPIILDLGKTENFGQRQSPATGESPKGDSR